MATNDANETKLAQAGEGELSSSRRSLDITDDTYRQAKALAAIHGETISQFFEAAAIERITRINAPKPAETVRPITLLEQKLTKAVAPVNPIPKDK